jgi:competence protein ComEC
MLLHAIAFFAGVLTLQFCSTLPPVYSYALVPVALVLSFHWPRTRIPALLVVGFFWAALRAEVALAPRLDTGLAGQTLLVEGTVLDIPRRISPEKTRFLFQADRLDAGSGWVDYRGRLRLSNYAAIETLQAGERWRLAVRLKPPHGFSNPGGFDYERWLFERRIMATGYIRKGPENRRLGDGRVNRITALRHRLIQTFNRLNQHPATLGMVQALTVGDRSNISPQQWDILRATGTSHLMAISGLHISLVAGLVFWLARFAWSRSGRLAERLPARKAAALAAIAAAVLYALLSGFNIPARRSVVMVAVVMLAVVSDRRASLMQALCLAVFVTLIIDPIAVLSVGWWLSFWAVVIIAWLISGRYGRQGIGQRWFYMHVVLAVAMLPALLISFQQASLVAPLANFLAVPWVGMLVVPVALLGTLLAVINEMAGQILLSASAWLLDFIWPWLEWLAQLDFALWHQHQPVAWTLLPAVLGLAVLFMPRGLPGRWAGLVMLLPLFLVQPDRPVHGEAWITVLDVGQGLATVVQTRRHTLVYDTGPRFSDNFDTGQAVVVPFLRHQGVRLLDSLIISHGDNDHIGGADSLLAAYPAGRLLAGVPEKLPGTGVEQCQAGDQWHWDGVTFSVLHPGPGGSPAGNDASCVVRIEVAAGQGALLTGDIEEPSEYSLLQDWRGSLSADVLVAPHHGSMTSSSPDFVKAVNPGVVLFPAGYQNRYHIPKRAVVERYTEMGAETYNTGDSGAIMVRLGGSPGEPPEISLHRDTQRRYWKP